MSQPGQSRQHNSENGDAELKASAYQLAHTGLVGLFIWIFRRSINDSVARHLTFVVAMAAWLGALVVLAIANRNGFDLLRDISIYAVIGIPFLALVAPLLRQQRDALAAEHGRDSEAYDKAIEAAHQKASKTVMEDDWILDPPWRRPEAKQKPRFGRQADR